MRNNVGFPAKVSSPSAALCHSALGWTRSLFAAQKPTLKKYSVLLSLVFALSALPAYASISNVYVAASASGAANGADCADAYAISFYYTSANWGTGSGQIGPGTTVHLCGTFSAAAGASNYLTTQKNGTSGNPITILFEPNAVLTAPYWGGPAISTSNNYITINGGTNGTIQATANGTNLANQNWTGMCFSSSGANNLIVENLTCSDIYVHVCNPPITSCTDTSGANGIQVSGGNNISIHNNTVHDAAWAIVYTIPGSNTESNVAIYSNSIYNCDHGPTIGDGNTNAILNGGLIYNNAVHDGGNWDDNSDQWHHDGIHVFLTHSGSSVTGLAIYNNYIYGYWGYHWTAAIYVEPIPPSNTTSFYIFNNVSINSQTVGGPADGYWYFFGNNCGVYNNTAVQGTASPQNGLRYSTNSSASSGCTVENNIFTYPLRGIVIDGSSTLTNSDYNDFYGLPANNAMYYNAWYGTLAAWIAGTGFDAHSITSNPKLNANGQPPAGSPVLGAGANLYSICNGQANPGLGALCYDKVGTARSSSSAWDMGAYQFSSSAEDPPVAPANLTATVQ